MAVTEEARAKWELRKQWFIDRIGKRVYRNKTSCDCATCERIYTDGIIISDSTHADYIFDCECIYNAEGNPLKYFDTLEERNVFEKELQKNGASA